MPDKKHKTRGDDPRHSQPKLRGDARPFHIGDQVWQWKTNGVDVTIYDPQGGRHSTSYRVVERLTEEEYQAMLDSEDRYEFPMPGIEPGAVKAFIESNLINA